MLGTCDVWVYLRKHGPSTTEKVADHFKVSDDEALSALLNSSNDVVRQVLTHSSRPSPWSMRLWEALPQWELVDDCWYPKSWTPPPKKLRRYRVELGRQMNPDFGAVTVVAKDEKEAAEIARDAGHGRIRSLPVDWAQGDQVTDLYVTEVIPMDPEDQD